jgi:hypothetical protein
MKAWKTQHQQGKVMAMVMLAIKLPIRRVTTARMLTLTRTQTQELPVALLPWTLVSRAWGKTEAGAAVHALLAAAVGA